MRSHVFMALCMMIPASVFAGNDTKSAEGICELFRGNVPATPCYSYMFLKYASASSQPGHEFKLKLTMPCHEYKPDEKPVETNPPFIMFDAEFSVAQQLPAQLRAFKAKYKSNRLIDEAPAFSGDVIAIVDNDLFIRKGGLIKLEMQEPHLKRPRTLWYACPSLEKGF